MGGVGRQSLHQYILSRKKKTPYIESYSNSIVVHKQKNCGEDNKDEMTFSVKASTKLLTNIPGNLKHRLEGQHERCFRPKIYRKNKIKTELHELTKGCIQT